VAGTRRERRSDILERVEALHEEGRRDELVAMIGTLVDEIDRLELLEQKLRKHRFGKRSEKLDPKQLALTLAERDELAGETGELACTPEHIVDEGQARENQPPRPERGKRKPLPEDLPRTTIPIPVPEAQRRCASCGREMGVMGCETSEELEWVPGHFEVRRYEREKRACSHCGGGGVVTAPTPDKVVEKGLPGPGLLAHVVVSKFQDHLPLYRQRQIFKRQGIDLPSATLGRWCAQAAWGVAPVAQEIRRRVLASYVLQTDDTHLRVLDRDHPQGIKRGFVWPYVGDGRWAYFDYTPSRAKEGPLEFLVERRGWVQADAYAGYDRLFDGEDARCIEVGCWAHARRRFVETLEGGDGQAAWPLEQIRTLYAIERELSRAQVSPEVRAKVRQEQGRPVLNALEEWLRQRENRLPPKSPLADAVSYTLNQWDALSVYLEDGHLDIDNNRVERLIRMVAVGRKNYLFAGSDAGARNAATHYTLIATCRLHGIDAQAYLADIYAKIAGGWPHARLAELLPDAWLHAHPDAPRCPFPA
jgi:transposase